MRRLIVLVPLAAVALYFALSSPEPSVDAPDAPEAPASAAAPERLPDIALAVDDDAPRVRRNRYRLTFAQDVTVAGVEQDGVRVEGTWTTEQLADGRVEVVLAADHLEGPAGMPSARALAAPVQWVARDGALVGMGFSDGAPAMARHVMTALATTLWSDDRDAARWEVEAEDVTGRFVAAYARADGAANVVTRTRPAWRALRSPAGLTTTLAKAVLSDEDSRFERDADGLVEANVSLTTVFEPEGDLPTVVGRVRARLVREDSVEVARRGGGDLAIGPIDDHLDLRARQAATDRATVDGASVAELVAEVERVAALDPEAAETARWRSVTMKRLAARVRTDPASARALADAIRDAGDDVSSAAMLVGALNSARTPAGNDALAGLLPDPLADATRRQVLTALTVSEAPTPASLAALEAQMDGELGAQAALAVGAQAGKLADVEPEATGSALETLIARFQGATTLAERRMALQALGNSGDPRVLPLLVSVIEGGDLMLAPIAAYGLRFMPSGAADDVLARLIAVGGPTGVQAVRATVWRDAGFWLPRLQAARAHFADDTTIAEAIDRALRRFG